MGALSNAAKFAKDGAVGGFRDLATAALVNQARGILATPPVPEDLVQMAMAKSVVRQASAWTETAAWAYAADPTVYVTVPPALPAESVLITVAASTWLALSRLAE